MSIRTRSTPESAVVRACLDLLRYRGVPAWRQNTGAARHGSRLVRYGIPGCADILGVVPRGPRRGAFLAIECKAEGGRPTDLQVAFLAAVRAAGGIAVIVRDVAELACILDALEPGPSARSTPEDPT